MILVERRRLKSYAYVTARQRLLVFREPDFPEIGLQVPGGTAEAGETEEVTLVRELNEELGRSDFVVRGPLGGAVYSYDKDGVRHVHIRRFFHVEPASPWPETWRHADATPDGGVAPVQFEFFWADLANPSLRLFAELDAMLPPLRAALGQAT
jgi:8-oxo-dGTP diphosphatase